MNRNVFAVSMALGLVLICVACQKGVDEPVADPTTEEPPPPPPPTGKVFRIAFGDGGIDIENTDSVLVRLTAGDNSVVNKKAARKGSNFEFSLDDLKAGAWQMAVEVFAQHDQDGNRFTLAKSVQLPLLEELVIKAPTNKLNDQWKIWLFFRSNELKFDIPLDPADPLFELSVKRQGWDFVRIEKILYQDDKEAANADWVCGSVVNKDCFSADLSLRDNSSFLIFSEKSKVVSWNICTVYLEMYHNDGNTDLTVFRRYFRK